MTNDEGQEVVIVDGAGTEHVFPPGFDPKRAAGIVRGSGQSPAFGAAPSAEDMLTRHVGAETNPHGTTPDWKTSLIETMQSAAHPHSSADLGIYLIPSATPQIVNRLLSPIAQGISKYGGAALEVGGSLLPTKARSALGVLQTLSPSEWHSPLTVEGREGRAVAASRAFNDLPLAEQMDRMPTAPPPQRGVVVTRPAVGKRAEELGNGPYEAPPYRGRAVDPPPRNLGNETQPMPSAPDAMATEAPASPLSPVNRQWAQKQGYPPELIARIEQRLAQSGVTPMASHPVSPLREPRVQVGAEQVGRQEGLTKESVRQVTGPVLDEARGEASPILPQGSLNRIIDDMKALPPGAEREAYVARATSGKAKWQVENIRRTLEHLGLIVPVAGLVREQLQRLMASHATAGETP